MTNPNPAPPHTSLPRKLVLLFLLVITTGLGIVFLFQVGYPLAYISMIFLDSAILGLVAGSGARIILKSRRSGLRMLAALAALSLGLIVLGFSTAWKYGLGPLIFNSGHFDWGGLIQMVIGTLTAILVLYAWRRPASTSLPMVNEPAPLTSVDGVSPQPKQLKAAKKRGLNFGKKLKPILSTRRGVRTKIQSTPKLKAKSGRAKLIAVRSRRRMRKADVQIATKEEHRCPYCLEPVRTNDPRGIVECKVCHTLHHADCWEITGVCQVPHQNNM